MLTDDCVLARDFYLHLVDNTPFISGDHVVYVIVGDQVLDIICSEPPEISLESVLADAGLTYDSLRKGDVPECIPVFAVSTGEERGVPIDITVDIRSISSPFHKEEIQLRVHHSM